MDFYIVRHGQTDFNKLGYYQGCLLNPSINEYGIEQAKRLRNKIYDITTKDELHIDIVYSSPLRRAYETAQRLIPFYKKLVISSSLTEGDFGIADGVKEEDIKEKLPEEYKRWKDLDDGSFSFKNGQSKTEIGLRMIDALWSIYNNHRDNSHIKTVLVVTHSCAIRCLLLQLGIREEEIPFGTVYHLQIDQDHFNGIKFIERN